MGDVLQAQLLMVASALLASVVSLDANFLTHQHALYHWTEVLFANGAVGVLVCVATWAAQYAAWRCRARERYARRVRTSGIGRLASEQPPSLLGARNNRGWLLLRGVFGASENACAWVALGYLNLADANCIMFTNPVFTGLLAWLLLGQRWRWYDNVLTLSSLLGALLVVRPPFLTERGGIFNALAREGTENIAAGGVPLGAEPEWQHWLGVAAAAGFAVTLAGANLIINAKVHTEHTNTITFYMFAGVVLTVWPSFYWVPPAGFLAHGWPFFGRSYEQHSTRTEGYAPLLITGIGVVFWWFQYCRSKAFQTSADASVVNLLYTELVFAFIWGSWLLQQPLYWSAIAGAGLIMAGTVFAGAAKGREEARRESALDAPLFDHTEQSVAGARAARSGSINREAAIPF